VLDINALPDDVHRLKRLLLEHHAASLAKDLRLKEKNREIEHLKWQLAVSPPPLSQQAPAVPTSWHQAGSKR
jgi:hypothetical protein